ncbi:hypothetical protein NG895_13650 [Aeoliella sp. ICT_H6.2]|uniref:HEPN domain-containing protein n=1 Tax=Aeoliella straminimaris TaxID=2954799 RepID=A0A9X2FAH4_9BACT|nr:hypothetical protein [Aeoliella straminimaris]
MGKKNKRKKKRPDPFLTYCNAVSFYLAARKLDSPNGAGLYTWPMVACEAFSLELSLKGLHHLRRRIAANSHNVHELFDGLSKTDKKRIQVHMDLQFADAFYINIQKNGVLLDILSILTRAKRMFIKIRYWHELDLPDSDTSGDVNTAGINELNYSILQVIQEDRPEWSKALSKLKSTRVPPQTQLT